MSYSNIEYNPSDLKFDQDIDKMVVKPDEVQKIALKLVAVSEAKQKLVGIVHYDFIPSINKFEILNKKVQYFVKSIDKNANITFSTQLKEIKVYKQEDYIETMKKLKEDNELMEFGEADDISNHSEEDEGGISM